MTAIANALTQHLGFSSGLLPESALWWSQSETGQVVALWRPPQTWRVALQREAFKPPARLRLPMPGLLFVCSPGRAPWVYAAASRPTDPEQQLFRSPTFNTFGDGRVCTGSHTFPEALNEIPESFFESYFSMTGDVRNRSKKHPDDHTNYGRSLMALLSTQLRTWFHSVPWPRSWRSQPRRRWSGWWGRAPRRARRNSTTWRRHEVLRPGLGPHSEKKQGDEKRCLTREETP